MPPDMMSCDASRLRSLLDDRLDEDDQEALARHLEGCNTCRVALEGLAAEERWWDDARRLAGGPDETRDDGGIAADEADALGFLDPPAAPGQLGKLGAYEVTEVIGRGGMGVVLKANDGALNRFVAIKVLAPELATSATARRRFAREARAVAAIAHDHIVAVHAVDATPGGLPYIVMQYVSGRSLHDRLEGAGPLDTRAALRIGMQAARGLAAAHAVGLVHRDVKPANILLENGVERVKLTDFGLARAADDASLTQSGVVAGTPQYMAPEQARGEPVDARSDLFSLGSVLYTALTGRPPFRAETTMGVLRRVSEDTPRPIRELNPEVPDWLQAIVEKLQAKAPSQRFESAAEVADLFGRCLAYLENPGPTPPFPVDRPRGPRSARPRVLAAAAVLLTVVAGLGASEASGVTKFSDLVATVLRIKTPTGTLVLQIDDPAVKVRVDGHDVVLTGAGPQEIRLGLSAGKHLVQKARAGVVQEEIITIARDGKQTVKVAFETTPAIAADARPADDRPAENLADLVKALEEENRRIEQDRSRLMKEAMRQPKLYVVDAPTPAEALSNLMRRQAGPTLRLPPGEAAGAGTTIVRLVPPSPVVGRPATPPLQVRARIRSKRVLDGRRVYSLAFSPDGKTIAAGSGLPRGDETTGFGNDRGALDVWVEPWQHDPLTALPAPSRVDVPHYLRGVAFSPDGALIATAAMGDSILLRDASEPGRTVRELRAGDRGVNGLAFTPDGKFLVAAGLDGTVQVWDAVAGRLLCAPPVHNGPVYCVAVSPDGTTFASGGEDDIVRAWELRGNLCTGQPRAVFPGHIADVEALAFSPDFRTLASASWDGTVRLWNGHGGSVVLAGHTLPVLGLAFSPDGRLLATAAGTWGALDAHPGHGELKLWDVAHGAVVANLNSHTDRVFAVAWSPDGKTLASGGWDGSVLFWAVETAAAGPPPKPRGF